MVKKKHKYLLSLVATAECNKYEADAFFFCFHSMKVRCCFDISRSISIGSTFQRVSGGLGEVRASDGNDELCDRARCNSIEHVCVCWG